MLKVIYLHNTSSPQEFQEVVNAVRTVPELTKVFPDTAQYAIVLKGEADRVALAEKIAHDLDKPRPEVLLDILVMEASSTFSRQITAAVASTGLNVPVNFTPRSSIQVQGSSTTNTAIDDLKHIDNHLDYHDWNCDRDRQQRHRHVRFHFRAWDTFRARISPPRCPARCCRRR